MPQTCTPPPLIEGREVVEITSVPAVGATPAWLCLASPSPGQRGDFADVWDVYYAVGEAVPVRVNLGALPYQAAQSLVQIRAGRLRDEVLLDGPTGE